MDGIVLLKEDHKAVKRLFREFEKTHKKATPAAERALVDKGCGQPVGVRASLGRRPAHGVVEVLDGECVAIVPYGHQAVGP